MDRSEAGKLGWEKSKEVLSEMGRQQQQKAMDKYNEIGKRCKGCQQPIPYEKRRNDFCCRSCSATYYNSKNPKRKKKLPTECRRCGSGVAHGRAFCPACIAAGYSRNRKENPETCLSSKSTRGYLLRTRPNVCSICGVSEWTGKQVPLIMDHIDGNAENNTEENLRLICPNCDALLPTYMGRNRGNGRAWRRERRRAGKDA